MEGRRDQMEFNTTFDPNLSVNMLDELSIDLDDLDTEFTALPGQIAYWAASIARFSQVVSIMEREYELWYAEVYNQAYKKLDVETGRKPNINSVEYLVKTTHGEEWLEKITKLEQAKTDLAVVQGLSPSFNAKLQCLMQLAKRRLEEYYSVEPNVKVPFRNTSNSSQSINLNETKNLLGQMKKRS
jgi:hypothetical protein